MPHPHLRRAVVCLVCVVVLAMATWWMAGGASSVAPPSDRGLAPAAHSERAKVIPGPMNSPQNGVAAQSGTAPPPVVNQAYPGPDRTKDRIGWIAWKLANKRSLSVGQISRACPEAATVATDVEEVHRSRDERLVEIARLGKAGAITPDEFHMAEKTIGQDFVRGLQALVGPVARSESCFAYLRQLDGAR